MSDGYKICKYCNIEKPLNSSFWEWRKDRNIFRNQCRDCVSKRRNEYYLKNKDVILEKLANIDKTQYRKRYYQKHKEEIINKSKQYNLNNKEKRSLYIKEYGKKNRKILTEKNREYQRKRRSLIPKKIRIKKGPSPFSRLKKRISNAIFCSLRKRGGSKQGKCRKYYLPYSMEELRKHLEDHFELWMNWGNWGVYNPKTWDENDSLTWTWQIDHIIPHSKFNYKSLEDPDFKKCWGLGNLRPYSAKLNVIERDRR